MDDFFDKHFPFVIIGFEKKQAKLYAHKLKKNVWEMIEIADDKNEIYEDLKEEKTMKKPTTKTITDKAPTLEEMQKFVGGHIEVVYAPNGDQIVIDEEGRLKGKEINKEASKHCLGDKWDDEYPNIVGDAMILKGDGRME